MKTLLTHTPVFAQMPSNRLRVLFDRHHVEVYETIYCLTESKSLSEAFVVQLFIDIWENPDSYNLLGTGYSGKDLINAYLARMMKTERVQAKPSRLQK